MGYSGGSVEPGVVGASGVNSDAEGAKDLPSTLVHELGHALGIIGEEPGEYNIFPHHVGGLPNVLVAEDDDSGHLAGDGEAPWLMCEGCGDSNVRRFPSATDALVVAEDQGLPVVHLARVDRINGGAWHSTLSWIGGQVPTANQDVFLRQGGTVMVDADGEAKTLLVASANTRLETQNYKLEVLGGPTVVFTELAVGSGGEATLDELQLNLSGKLRMLGGTVTTHSQLSVNSGSGSTASVDGQGTVRIADLLLNNGIIRADGGTLTFQYSSLSPTILDLDGDGLENGQLFATQGDLVFEASLTDAFHGWAEVGEGRTVSFVNGRELGDTVFSGKYSPGASPTAVEVEGNVSLFDTATLEMEIGGVNPGDDYDVLVVHGEAALGGTLVVTLLKEFLPQVGDRFDVIKANGGLDGMFGDIVLPTLSPGLALSVSHAGDALSLEVAKSRWTSTPGQGCGIIGAS